MGVSETALGSAREMAGREPGHYRRTQPPKVDTVFVVTREERTDPGDVTFLIGLYERADAETVVQKGSTDDITLKVIEFPVANSAEAAMEVLQAKDNARLRAQALARLSYAEKVALGLI